MLSHLFSSSHLSRRLFHVFLSVGLLFLLLGLWRVSLEVKRVQGSDITAWTQSHSADCAVVLTGGRGRVSEGFDLLSQGRVKKLIISGVYPKASLREIFPQWLFYGNLSEKDVILEKISRTTYGNAKQSFAIVTVLDCRDIVLITSRLHMYRALSIFQSLFPDDFPIYERSILAGRRRPSLMDLSVEVMKSLFYSLWAY